MRLGLGLGLGVFNSAATGGRRVTQYLFLDGGCLRARLREVSRRYCKGAPLQLDWQGVAGSSHKVFYYDALPVRKPNQTCEEFEAELAEAEELHAKLATLDRFRVNEGDTRFRKGRREQKKVDVMIAVDMMLHTIRRNMDHATLLAGDGDFTPLLNALSNEGMFTTLWHPPAASKDLLAAADARDPLTVFRIYNWMNAASRAHFTGFPTPSSGGRSHDENCRLLWSGQGEEDVQAWLHLPDSELWVSWHQIQRGQRFNLRGGSWSTTRLLAADEFGITLPEEPPEGL